MKALPSSGPKASSAAATTSHSVAVFSRAASGSAARSSSCMAARRSPAPATCASGTASFGTSSLGIQRGLQLLHAPLLGVPAVVRDQLAVRAAFGDVAVAQHHDLVGVQQRRQAVAGDD